MGLNAADLAGAIVALAIPLAVGGIGGLATAASIPTWYRTIRKPGWNPPDWVFAPVWTLLYLLMGVALWLVWRAGSFGAEGRLALVLFGAQLALNLLWSFIFFTWHRPGLALVEIAVLWVLIALTLVQFYRVEAAAGILLVPYLAWVTFAAGLNAAVWRLNA